MPRTALYAGSFDPVTNGHLDVVRHAVRLADRLVLAVGVNPGKAPLFSAEDRLAMLQDICAPIAREAKCELACVTFSGLVVEAARKAGATLLVRGLRDSTDFNYEMQMAGMNAAMAPEMQTVFLPASADGAPDHRHIGAPDRRHGRRCYRLRAGRRRRAAEEEIRPRMIPKSGNRFSDKIMRKQKIKSGEVMIRILAVVVALVCAAPAVAQVKLPAGLDPQNTILLDTKDGRVIIKLRNDLAPIHAERIKQLTREGFYNNVPFHRVIAGFMAQTGDGQYGNGTGGSKYPQLKAEFSSVPFARGILGMARTSDPILGQFAILHHVCGEFRLEQPIHRDRPGGVRHGHSRQDQEGTESEKTAR